MNKTIKNLHFTTFYTLLFLVGNLHSIAQDNVTSLTTLSDEQMIELLETRREQVRLRAYYCAADSKFPGQYSHAKWSCNQGDLPIFAGINCLAAKIIADKKSYSYCQDMANSQSKNGKFWRGESNIDVLNISPATFSKDQAFGVLSFAVGSFFFQNPPLAIRDTITNSLFNWMNFIETEQKGKFLCEKRQPFGNPCDIFQGKGFPDIMHRVLSTTKALEKGNSDWTLIKKLNKKESKFNWNKFRRELLITPSGFQTHLKSLNVLLHRSIDKALGENNLPDDTYYKIARRFFKRDERNPWHYLMFKGVDPILFERVLKDYCPAELPARFEQSIEPGGSGYSWQDKKNRTGWEAGDGHDCIFLINMMLADLNGLSPLEFERKDDSDCLSGSNNFLGTFSSQNVCEHRKDLSLTQCEKKGGNAYYLLDSKFLTREEIIASTNSNTNWSKTSFEQQFCLISQKGFYAAHSLKSICPLTRKFIAFWDWENFKPYSPSTNETYAQENFSPVMTPICSAIIDKKMNHYRCDRKVGNFVWSNDVGEKFCMVNKSTFMVKKPLSAMDCPVLTSKIGIKQGWGFPICKSIFMRKITLEDCLSSTDFPPENGYCLFPKKGHFKGRKISFQTEDVEPPSSLPIFETKVVDWVIENSHDRVSIATLDDEVWNVEGTLSWFTQSDRANDKFVVKFLYRSRTESEWEEILVPVSDRTIDVEFDRKLHHPAIDQENFKGQYQLHYEIDIPYRGPETQVKFEIYLEKFDQNNEAKLVLSSEHDLLTRGQEIFNKISLYPNPISSQNLSTLNLALVPGVLTVDQQNAFALKLHMQLLSTSGQILADWTADDFDLANPSDLNVGASLFTKLSDSLPIGHYFFRVQVYLDGVYAQDYMTSIQVF